MLLTVIQQEFRLVRRDATWIALAALVFIAALAAVNGAQRSKVRVAETAGLVAAEREMTEAVQRRAGALPANSAAPAPATSLPGALGWSILSQMAVLPAEPLAPLAVGQSDLHPSFYVVTAHEPHTFMNGGAIANSLALATGSFDLAFVMVFVMPIFVIAMVYDLLSRERERGTLALAAAHGISVLRFSLARCCARTCLMLLVVNVVSVVAFVVSGIDWGAPGAFSTAVLWMLMTSFYAIFWFATALVVNAWPRSSDSNGVVMANVWLVLVVVMPALLNIAATTLYPAPSRVELTTELREAATIAEEQAAQAREDFFFDHPDLVSIDQDPEIYFREVQRSEAQIAAALAPLLSEFDSAAGRRAELVNWLQYLSPAIVAQRVFAQLAGTDEARFDQFRRQVVGFHAQYQQFFAIPLAAGATMSGEQLGTRPAFEFAAHRASWSDFALPFGSLLMTTLALIAFAFPRLSRYPVTPEAA